MKEEFLKLAKEILHKMELSLTPKDLQDDYVYKNIPRLVDEIQIWKFSATKTDIGLAAMKLYDMGFYKDEDLVEEISHLGELYRLIQKPAARI